MRSPAFWKGIWSLIVEDTRKGSYLYTLTLTDVATGWTECLPLLARTSDLVVSRLGTRPHAVSVSHFGD